MKTFNAIAVGLGAAFLFACSGTGDMGADGELTGTASVAITSAPPDGTCLQITAVGNRTVVKSFDLMVGASTVLQVNGLPLGAVTFSGNAFGGTCASVNAMTVPNWISSPVVATVAVTPPVSVALSMKKNGSANISVDFSDDGGSSMTPDSSMQPPMCMAPQVACGSSCVSTSNDVNNCGGCGVFCGMTANGTPSCVNGMCTVGSCIAPFGDCNQTPVDGCETNLNSNPNNCGMCGRICVAPNGSAGCQNGACTVAICNPGFGDCNASAIDGCETNLNVNPNSCGMCGHACVVQNGTAGCLNSACTVASCNNGFGDCNASAADGCETNIQTSTTNCGGCGHVCTAMQTCTNGVCH
jgi:hypothetical protein